MYCLKQLQKNTYSLLLVTVLLFWEIILYPASVAEDLALLCAQGTLTAGVNETYITGETVVVQEANLPEIVGGYTHLVSVSPVFSGRTFRGRSAVGRFLLAFFTLCLLLGEGTVLSKYRFFENWANQNLDLLLSFIHDQDGKKKIH